MRKVLLVLLVISQFSYASSKVDWSTHIQGQITFEIPPVVLKYMRNNNGPGDEYEVYKELNPMYQRLDINGDGKYEYALLVKNVTKDTVGILICYDEMRGDVLFSELPVLDLLYNEKVDDLDAYEIDMWYVSSSKTIEQKPESDAPPVPKGESLVIGRSESYTSHILWDGSRYVTY